VVTRSAARASASLFPLIALGAAAIVAYTDHMAKKPEPKKPRTRKAAEPAASNVLEFPSPLKKELNDNHRYTYRTEENKAIILDLVLSGMSLLAISRLDGFPSDFVLRAWMRDDPEFYTEYARAWQARADRLVDEIIEIADDGSNDWVDKVDRDGEVIGRRIDHEAVARSKLKIDTRIWVAGRMKPKKFGKVDPDPEPVRTQITDIDPALPDDESGRIWQDAIRGE